MRTERLKQFQKTLVSEYLYRSQFLFLMISLISGFITVGGIGVIQWMQGDYNRAIYDFISLAPFLIFFFLFFVKKKLNLTTIASLSGILFSTIAGFYTGGVYGSALVYHFLIPVLIAFLLRFEQGIYLFITYLIILTSVLILQLTDFLSTVFEIGQLIVVVFNAYLLTTFCAFISHRQEKVLFALNRERFLDSLTGYPNRTRMLRDLSGMQQPALLLVNIDNFKEVNDIFGYRDGDEILIKTADYLQDLLDQGIVYRLSGSDFGILLELNEDDSEILKDILTKQVRKLLSSMEPLSLTEKSLTVDISIGVAFSPVSNVQRMISDCDIALQEAKHNQAKFVFYAPDLETERIFKADLKWKKELEQAIIEKRVFPYYQPIVKNQSGEVEKYECLARFLNNKGSIHLPNEFLPIAQRNNLYSKITRSMLKQVLESINLHKRGVSINLSAIDLNDSFTRHYILTLLNQYKDIGDFVQFEILESEKAASIELIRDFIAEVKEFNCTIAIDDFGSGYSNFDYLSKYDIDVVKIDGSLIKNLHIDKRSYMLVSNILNFCRELNIKTVAEYVHSKEIFDIVKSLGIDYSQGFYFSKPCPIDQLQTFYDELVT